MNYLRLIAVPVMLAMLLGGCATTNSTNWFDHWSKCAMAGGLAGATIGAMDDVDSATAAGLGGVVLGGLFCALNQKEAPAPVYISDTDNDGVQDDFDRCPNTRANTAVDNNGCQLADTLRLQGVSFHHDSARLTDRASMILDSAVNIMIRHPELDFEIAGHTDSQGAAAYNRDLSLRRAESVRRYLVSRGANPSRLTARGYGESDPVADNRTPEGRAFNRRVELRQY